MTLNQNNLSQVRRIKYLLLLIQSNYGLKVKYNDKYYKQV